MTPSRMLEILFPDRKPKLVRRPHATSLVGPGAAGSVVGVLRPYALAKIEEAQRPHRATAVTVLCTPPCLKLPHIEHMQSLTIDLSPRSANGRLRSDAISGDFCGISHH